MTAPTTTCCWFLLSVATLASSGDGAAQYARPITRQAVKPLTPAQLRQVQQWQVAINLPPGSQVQHTQGPPPGPAAPGHIWIQVPAPQQYQPPQPPAPQENYPPQPPPTQQPPQTPPANITPPPPESNDPDLGEPPKETEPEYPEKEEEVDNESEPGDDNDPDSEVPVKETDPGVPETAVPAVPSKPMTPAGPLAPGDEDGASVGLHPGNEDGASIQTEDGGGVEVAEDREVIPHVVPGPVGEAWEIAQVPEGTGDGEMEELLKSCKAARGQFPSEQSCSRFVNCWDDVAVEQECPAALVFNDKDGYCDYPENVACGARPIKKPVSMGESDECPTPYGRYRSSTSCGIFYMCDGGRAIKFECPGGLNYNADLGVCDYATRVDCDGTPWDRPPTEEPAPEEPAPEEPAPEEPAPEEPEEALVVPPPAPFPAVTAPARRKYNTGLRKVPASTVSSRVACRHDAVYRLNRACTSVSMCQRGYTTVVNCGRGKAWDAKARACISAKKARC